MEIPTLREFLVEIGKRCVTQDSWATFNEPPLEHLLADAHAHRIGNEWQEIFSRELTILSVVSTQCLKWRFPEEFPKALDDFMTRYYGSGTSELSKLFDHPRNFYLNELMLAGIQNADAFKRLLELFVELGGN